MKKTACLALLATAMATVWLLEAAVLPAAQRELDAFQRLVILEGGRKKPLDTFARNLLKQFSGRASLPAMDASTWLARVFFSPPATLGDKIFLVNHPDVLAAIGLGAESRGRYSFADLRPGLETLHRLAFQYSARGEGGLGRVENETIRLFYNVSAFVRLLNAFQFARVDDPAGMDAQSAPALPAILPVGGDSAGPWLSPAQVLASGSPRPAPLLREMSLLAQAARSYAESDPANFNRSLDAFNRSIRNRLGAAAVDPGKISLEIFYNRLDPFFKAELAYILALLFLILSPALRRFRLERISMLLFLIGFLLHTFGLSSRMLIMNRPPVTNLYETFVFVAWASIAIGLFLAWLQKQALGLLAGGLAGLVFMVIAGRYSLDGDTMGMLAAVLDSNLWLATHVVTISLGYAGCVVAGIIGHVVLMQKLLRSSLAAVSRTADTLYATLAFGLVFTCIGTAMGGIWADQAWGRFWGWDPKENGALLIILWCAVLFHARLAGWIGQVGLAAGSIGGIIAVALAWFGVNLLGVGMHAYGFTSGAALGLIVFIGLELLFVAVTGLLLAANKN